MMVDQTSIPSCNSFECQKKTAAAPIKDTYWSIKDPKEYSVPNFGVDSEIAETQAHEKSTAATMGVTWAPKKVENEKTGEMEWDSMPTATA